MTSLEGKNEKAAFWLEGAPELGVAKSRVEELLSFWPGEYQIFDLETREVVLTSSCLRRANRHATQQFR
jgi:hypothetical protein